MALHFGGCTLRDIWREYASEEAARRGDKPVKVTYYLEDNENRAALEKAFDSVNDKDGDVVTLETVSDEDAVKIVHLAMQLRAWITGFLREDRSAKIIVPNGEPEIIGEPKKGDGFSIVHPGFRVRTLNHKVPKNG